MICAPDGTDPDLDLGRGLVIGDLWSDRTVAVYLSLVGPPTAVSFSRRCASHLMCVLMIGHADRLGCCHRDIASLSLCMENHVPQTPGSIARRN